MKWITIRERLKRDFAAPDPPTEARFWRDFKERIRFEPSLAKVEGTERTDTRHVPADAWMRVRRALVPAAAAIAVAVLLHIRQSGPTQSVPNRPVSIAGALSTVEDIDVIMNYDSVFIVEDPKSRGTLVWVAGANSASPGG